MIVVESRVQYVGHGQEEWAENFREGRKDAAILDELGPYIPHGGYLQLLLFVASADKRWAGVSWKSAFFAGLGSVSMMTRLSVGSKADITTQIHILKPRFQKWVLESLILRDLHIGIALETLELTFSKVNDIKICWRCVAEIRTMKF